MTLADTPGTSAGGLPTSTVLAINQLVAEFCLRNDRPEFGSVAELFKTDGVLVLGALTLEGREAIAAFFAQRNATHAQTGRVTRHVCGPIALKAISPARLEMHCAMLVFAGAGDRPIPSEPPSTVGDFDAVCELEADGEWRFAHRKATSVFSSPKASYYVR